MWGVPLQRHRLACRGMSCGPGTTGRLKIGEALMISLRRPGDFGRTQSEVSGAAGRQQTRQVCLGKQDLVVTLDCGPAASYEGDLLPYCGATCSMLEQAVPQSQQI